MVGELMEVTREFNTAFIHTGISENCSISIVSIHLVLEFLISELNFGCIFLFSFFF